MVSALKKNMVVRVRDSELDYGRGGVTKKEALREYAGGYMEGVNRKSNSTYKSVKTVKFVSGQTAINKQVHRQRKRVSSGFDFGLF
jgi:hypothetical protein